MRSNSELEPWSDLLQIGTLRRFMHVLTEDVSVEKIGPTLRVAHKEVYMRVFSTQAVARLYSSR